MAQKSEIHTLIQMIKKTLKVQLLESFLITEKSKVVQISIMSSFKGYGKTKMCGDGYVKFTLTAIIRSSGIKMIAIIHQENTA